MAKELPNQIVGTGKNSGRMYFHSGGNKYSEVVLGEEKNGKQAAVPTMKQYTYEEILAGQEQVAVAKRTPTVDSSVVEAKRTADLIRGVTTSLAALPSQEELDRLVESARNQLVVGNIAIPSLMESLESISRNLDISKLSQIEEAFGAKAVATQKSDNIQFDWQVAKSNLELDIAAIKSKRSSLDPQSPDYSKKVEELDTQELNLRKDFNSKYPVPPEPVTEIKYLIDSKLLGVTSTIDAMVKSINKVSSTEMPNGSRVERRMRKLSNTIVNTYDSMVSMLAETAGSLNSADLESALGWKESGMGEYVTVTKVAPDGTEYKEYLTKKQYNSSTGKTEDVKIKNIEYFKPHFAAEETILHIGEIISKMVDPIQKVSSMDLSNLKGPIKLRRNIRRLSNSMTMVVQELVKSFSKIDTSGSKEALELLMGSNGSEKVIENIQSLSREETGSSKVNQSTEKIIEGKRPSVIDIVSAFLDTCNKITAFDFKPVLKKSLKFKVMSPLLAKAFTGVVESMYGMVPNLDYENGVKNLDEFAGYMGQFPKKAFDPLTKIELPFTGMQKMDNQINGSARRRKKGKDTVSLVGMVDSILGGIGNIMYIEKTWDEKLGEEDTKFKNISNSISSITSLFDEVGEVKESAKNAIGTGAAMMIARQSIGTVMETYGDITEYASKLGDTDVTPIAQKMSAAMTMLEPGIVSLGNISAISQGMSEGDTSRTTDAILSFVNAMDIVVDSGAAENIKDLSIISNSLEDAITSVTKLATEASTVSEDGAWIDLLFDKEDGVMTKFIHAMVSVYESIKESELDSEGIEAAGESIDSLNDISKALVGVMAAATIISFIANHTNPSDETEEKSKKLIGVLIAPVKEISENEEDIKKSFKPLVLLALEILVIATTIVLVGAIVATHLKEALIGFAAVVVLVGAAIGIMKFLANTGDDGTIRKGTLALLMIAGAFLAFSLSILILGLAKDATLMSMLMFVGMVAMAVGLLILLNHLVNKGKLNKEGMPEICMPLLLIGASFIMFSMSILLLGLVQDLTWQAMVGFVLVVGAAVGVLFLLSKLKADVIKGSLALMIAGVAFMLFSTVILILSHAAENADFLELMGLVGVIGALVLVAVGAGFAIIPLALGSLGLILLSVGLIAFSVALTTLFGVSKIVGKYADKAIGPLVDTIDILVSRIAALSMAAVATAMANSVMLLVFTASMVGVVVMIQALKAIAPKPNEVADVSLAMQGVAAALNEITKAMAAIDMGAMTKAMVLSFEALLMLIPLSLVALILLGFSRMRIATEFDDKNKPIKWESLDGSSFDRVGTVMGGLAGALNVVVKELNKISIKEISKGLLVANEALIMMLPLSLVALILLGLSRLRIATEFDDKNKPIKWESLDGNSFDRVGDTMANMVNAINTTVKKINEIGLVEMTKAVAKSVEMLGMMAALSGIMAILVKMGSGRIATEWDEKNKPKAWEKFDIAMIGKSVEIANLLVNSVGGIATAIATYDTKDLKKAKKNAKTLKGIMKPVSSMLDLVVKLTSGPISYGPCDEDGNPIGNGDQVIKGSLGDYLKTHGKQVESNIESLIGIFNIIAEKVTGNDGIGNVNKSTLKKAKKNMKLVGGIVGSLQPMIDLIISLTSGQYNVGTEEEPDMRNLGDFISEKKGDVTTNLQNLFDFVNWIGKKADEMNEGPSNRELRRANRKMGKIGDIIESMNAPLDLILKLSDGEFEIKDDEGNVVEKMNLGQYIAAKSSIVEGNIDTLIDFIGHIGKKINENLNGEGGPSKRELKRADKKTGLIGDVLETMMGTLELIEKMASGQIQVGVNDNGEPIMQSLDKFLKESAKGISKNMQLLIDFIVGPNGIQSHLDKITGEKSKTSEKKKNAIENVQSFADTIDKILDMTIKMGKQIDDPKTKDLFGTDPDKSMKGRLGRLMAGYAYPLDDKNIFARDSQFKVRYRNLTDYDKLMKKIMEVKQVENFEKSVKATGDMVEAINSISDSKIDRLNRLMVNMTKFAETVDEQLKEVFDKIVELAEELHYIIEADMRKNDPEEYRRMKKQEERERNAQLGQQQSQQQPNTNEGVGRVDLSTVESSLSELTDLVESIKNNGIAVIRK